MNHIEVNQQSKRFAAELQIQDHLRLMHRRNRFHGFNLYDDKVVHQQIDTISEIEFHPVVNDGKRELSFTEKSSILQFIPRACFVGTFQ